MGKKKLPNVPCPRCGNLETVGHGTNNTKKAGIRYRRKCNKCASTFYADEVNKKVEAY